MHWLAELRTLLGEGQDVVRVCIAQARGSTPRDAGTSMLVTRHRFIGTIGGGQLEFLALEKARDLMVNGHAPAARLLRLPLGGDLGQCCGGHASLIFERFNPTEDLAAVGHASARLAAGEAIRLRVSIDESGGVERSFDPWVEDGEPRAPRLTIGSGIGLEEILTAARVPLWLWGSGHVGRAIVRVLEDTAFALTWLDQRSDSFPPTLPASVRRVCEPDIAARVDATPPKAFHLIMTHSHELDYQIVRGLLERGQFAWLGLIGSETKATCFRIRLSRDGVSDQQILRVISPIGLPELRGKAPSTIAIAVAAQLLGQLAADQR